MTQRIMPWDGVIPEDELEIYRGFFKRKAAPRVGDVPALLAIDLYEKVYAGGALPAVLLGGMLGGAARIGLMLAFPDATAVLIANLAGAFALGVLFERLAERIVPTAQLFHPVLDDIYELTTAAPTPVDVTHRRRLAPEAVVALDWHNDMTKLILDINERIDAAADDRARGVIIRKLRRALESEK